MLPVHDKLQFKKFGPGYCSVSVHLIENKKILIKVFVWPRIIVEDAGFEPGAAASAGWRATNESPLLKLYKLIFYLGFNIFYIIFIKRYRYFKNVCYRAVDPHSFLRIRIQRKRICKKYRMKSFLELKKKTNCSKAKNHGAGPNYF